MAKNDARFPTVGANNHLAPGNSPDLPDLVPSGPSSGARLKRATTVPFDAPPVKPRRNRIVRGVLGIAFWLVLLVGGTTLIVAASQSADPAGSAHADSGSEAYIKAVDDFHDTWSARAITELGDTSIGITLETKYDEFSQPPRAYGALAEQCAALDTTRERFDDLAAVPPPAPPSSAQTRNDPESRRRIDAVTLSIAPLAAAANELLIDGAAQLETLDVLCDSLTRLKPIVDERASETATSVTPLMIQPGASEQVATATGTVEFSCTGDEPCQPLASPAREAYGTAVSAVNTRFDTAAAGFYSAHCPVFDLADYCALASDLWSQRAAVDTESEARFAKETPLNSPVPLPEYTAWLEKTSAELTAGSAALDEWMATYNAGGGSGGTPPASGDNAFVTAVSSTAQTAESRFDELRDAASAAASSTGTPSTSTSSTGTPSMSTSSTGTSSTSTPAAR
jgi:hypothetical protein